MKWILTETRRGERAAAYIAWLERMGIGARVVSLAARIPDDLGPYSALLLTGGGDVDPALYGARRAPETRGMDPGRDRLEIELVRRFVGMRRPVFAVCRGIQILNVAFRGKLVQHVPSRVPAGVEEHRQVDGKDSVHAVRLVAGTQLASALPDLGEVNSSHHQSVDPDALGNGLRVAALSPAAVVEAVEGEGLDAPVLAVQWHPERMPPGPGSDGLLRLMAELATSC